MNPAAAGGRVRTEWKALEPSLRRAIGPVAVRPTREAGDGRVQARQAVESGMRTVLSLGGDGTHNEVVNGIMDAIDGGAEGPVTFGVLPFGTGGDFRKVTDSRGSLIEIAERVAASEPAPIDVGWAEYKTFDGESERRHFLNICSFGIGGLTNIKVEESNKKLPGKVTFFLGGLKAYTEYVPPTVRLSVDGRVVGEFPVFNIAMGNGRFYGGGMQVAPHARLSDGMLDVVVQKWSRFAPMLRAQTRTYTGDHIGDPTVEYFRGSEVYAECIDDRRAWIDLDGEAPGEIPIRAGIRSGALELLAWDAHTL